MVLTRKSSVIGLLAIFAVVAAGIVVGTIMAQGRSNLKEAMAPKEGDSELVATVDGLEVYRGDIRRGKDFWITVDPSATENVALEKSIVVVIDGFVAEAEIGRRELTPTSAEVEEYMQPHRETCVASAECVAIIEALGFDPNDDDYWQDVGLPEYAKAVGEIKLFRAVVEERGLQGADNDTLVALRSSMISEMRDSATIVWEDDDLEDAYGRALAAE